ncbi:hypothetical protein [Haloferax sulfurifontis]|uniref:Uncharacterized protein n=1 Tax=Haloferax sulfurifontis TaxID=255616 RepID=A0A830DPW0_9EURY|nr:hypothetical protein [Haloferax sulfurifontis]GGC49914.1 hypothetical protein GCM10007209_09470 [Haloferax sulfurifontis]
MSDDTEDERPDFIRTNHEDQYPDDARDALDDEDEPDEPGNELGTEGDEGWEEDMDTSYDVPDRSTISPEELIEARPGTLVCHECEEEMHIKTGSSSHDCECGHSWRVICVPAGVMDETRP